MMNDDLRFPNRKRRDLEQPGLEEKLTEASLQYPDSKETEEKEPLRNSYKIIESVPEAPADKVAEAELSLPIGATTDGERHHPAGKPAIPLSSPLAGNSTRISVLAGVSLGILFGVILATFLWHSDNSNGQYDLGSVTSSATGLKGHLIIEWDKKAEYRLTLEPSDRDQQAGFALAVAYPPRPLAIGIQLKDNQGVVLCAKDIELKHDAQNQIRPDGQIEAIHAQGEIPCSKKACESISSWSFSTNFPSLAEQVQMLKRQEELQANAARSAPQAPAARKNIVPVTILPFSIEGDDLIEDFDASGGVIETRGRKTFLLDRASAEASDSRWQDYPVSIHYKCDQNTNCTLTHSGLHALRARLKR